MAAWPVVVAGVAVRMSMRALARVAGMAVGTIVVIVIVVVVHALHYPVGPAWKLLHPRAATRAQSFDRALPASTADHTRSRLPPRIFFRSASE